VPSPRPAYGRSLAEASPELVAEWHPTKNGKLRPETIVATSEKKVWWKCAAGPDHEWQAKVEGRRQGRGCPFCSGNRVSVTNGGLSFLRRPPFLDNEQPGGEAPSHRGVLAPDAERAAYAVAGIFVGWEDGLVAM
jgi:hypothetical protein